MKTDLDITFDGSYMHKVAVAFALARVAVILTFNNRATLTIADCDLATAIANTINTRKVKVKKGITAES